MKRITLFLCACLASTALSAFETYQDSTMLTNADIVACEGKEQSYKTWTLTDERGFEYSGCFIKNQHSNDTPEQYIQLKKFTSDPYSWLQLPEVGFPIEEITLTIGDNTTAIGTPVQYERYIYFIKENFPGQFNNGALDTVGENCIVRQEVTGLTSVTLKPETPTATTGFIIAGDNGGFRIWDVKLKWTVDKELPCSRLTIDPKELTLAIGGSKQLAAKRYPANSTETLSWKSLNEAIATVTTDGVVAAEAEGTTDIVVLNGDGTVTDTCHVTVRQGATAIVINIDSEEVDTLTMVADIPGNIFDTESFGVTFLPDGSFVEEVRWSSSDANIVTINATSGVAQAQSPGEARIFAATVSGLQDSCVVIVKSKPQPEEVIVSEHLLEFAKGDYTTLSATVLPADLDDDLKEVSWESRNERVATVSTRGYVVAVGAGTTYIVATAYNGVADSCKVVVSGQPTEGEYFVKVTAEPASWEGKYLIVCEEYNLAFDGSLNEFDVSKNTKTVSIADEAIVADSETMAISFDIRTTNANNYSIQGAGGKFIGYNAAETEYNNINGLQTSTTALPNKIELDGLNVNIIGADGSKLRYNIDETSSGRKLLFRYYQDVNNAILIPIQLYRYIGTNTAIRHITLDDVYYADGIVHNNNNRYLEIYNINGILLTTGNGDINIDNFATGIYIVKSDNGVLKIVK
ncbi:MAG: Ig-like domain-containing protein [Paludibacteraceae bacterium]